MRKNKKTIFDDRRVILGLSVLLAVLAWVIIAGFIKPGESTTLTDVSINYRQKESNYKNLDLSLIGDLRETVTVDIEGDSNVIYRLSNADIIVAPDYSKVTGEGSYTIPLRATREVDGNFDVVKIRPETITLRFEKIQKITLTVQAKADGIEAAEGYFKDTLVVTPTTIDVSGPESEIAKITQAVATVPDSEIRSETKYYGTSIDLLDETGAVVDTTLLTLSVSEVEITVPILEVKEVPLVPSFSGLPSGFDIEWFQSLLTISNKTIHVAAAKDSIDSFTECSIGPIDLSLFEIGKEYEPFAITFSDKLKNKIKNLDQLKQVTVNFDTSGLVEKTFKVNKGNIEVQNVAAGLTITPANDNGINVNLVGPKEVMEGLLPENIVVQIDAFGVSSAQGGQQSISARVVVASSSRVFATGEYSVVCDVKVAS